MGDPRDSGEPLVQICVLQPGAAGKSGGQGEERAGGDRARGHLLYGSAGSSSQGDLCNGLPSVTVRSSVSRVWDPGAALAVLHSPGASCHENMCCWGQIRSVRGKQP